MDRGVGLKKEADMTKITVEMPINGYIEKRFEDGNDDCGWIELSRQFTDLLKGLGYFIPEDFGEYLDKKESQTHKSVSVFEPIRKFMPVKSKDDSEDTLEDGIC